MASLLAGKLYSTLGDKFCSKVEFNLHGCWNWLAYKDRDGYGLFVAERGKTKRAHRVAYEAAGNYLPKGKPLDHLCRNRGCVRPDHLELVTPKINSERGSQATKTHCKRGHEFSPENTYVYENQRGCRRCRAGAESRRRMRMKINETGDTSGIPTRW